MDALSIEDNFLTQKDFPLAAGNEARSYRFKAIAEHLFSDLNGEAVILSMKTGKYYGLNAVGSSIWKVLQKSASIEEIESAVMKEYLVDAETCHAEVRSFLLHMKTEKLIEILNEKDS